MWNPWTSPRIPKANGWVSLAILTAGASVPKCMKIGDLSITFRRKVKGDDDHDDEKEVRVRCVELRRKIGFFYLYSSIIRHGT